MPVNTKVNANNNLLPEIRRWRRKLKVMPLELILNKHLALYGFIIRALLLLKIKVYVYNTYINKIKDIALYFLTSIKDVLIAKSTKMSNV